MRVRRGSRLEPGHTVIASLVDFHRYHLHTCEWANKIQDENVISFRSPAEAEATGRGPCRICDPHAALIASATSRAPFRGAN
jgi:hypothetical protein